MLRCARVATGLMLVVTASCGGDAPAHPVDASSRGTAQSPSPSRSDAGSQPGGPSDGPVLTIDDRRVQESSGLARSSQHPGVLYTHNDRGDTPNLFAVDASGTRAVLRLIGSPSVDWEDLASTPNGLLWVADIGDAEERRQSISVSVADEPALLSNAQLPTATYRFRYPDGRHNAEALLVHPETYRVHIVTKEPEGGRVYAAPRELELGKVHVLRPVTEAPPNVTAGEFSPDGRVVALRNYSFVFFYSDLDSPPVVVRAPVQRQPESITFDETGTHVFLGSEGDNSSVLHVAVPKTVLQ
jgi:hypothetical protein